MSNKINIQHITMPVANTFSNFIANLDTLLGRIPPEILNASPDYSGNTIPAIKASEGYRGLILFGKLDHGKLLNIALNTFAKAIQYSIGNPLIALEMTKFDIRAALYAPVKILVYEDENKHVYVDYDLPSSLFGQFGNAGVSKVALQLDNKLLHLINHANQDMQTQL